MWLAGKLRGGAPGVAALLLLAASGVSLDGQTSHDRYRQWCADGDADTCAVLGLMYERGAGVAQDLALAATFYRRACDADVQLGCTNLGILLKDGMGVSRDLVRATELFRVACEREEPLACDLHRAAARAADATYFKVGHVEDASNGRPIDGAIVHVDRLDLHAISDGFGRVELGRLRPGRYAIRVERFGYEPLDGVVDVPGNAEFVVIMTQDTFEDPRAPGRIVGQVTDVDYNAGLSDVMVMVRDTPTGTLSNAQGTFVLRGVEPGLLEVQFQRIGYGTRTATVLVQPGATVEVSAGMSTRPIELDAVNVAVTAPAYDRQGFESRARSGFGTHFTPEDLERLRPQRMAELLRTRVNGITTVTDWLGTHVVGRRSIGFAPDLSQALQRLGPGADPASVAEYVKRGDLCELTVFLDGVPVAAFDLDSLDPQAVEAVEVYQGVNTPTQYLHNTCGGLVIWTRLGN